MQKNLEVQLHSGNLPDRDKNPEKWEKLRLRTARLATKLNVMQRASVAEMADVLSPGQLRQALTHMAEADFLTLLEFLDADQRMRFLSDIGTGQLIGTLERLQGDKRKKVLEMMSDGQRAEVELRLPREQRGTMRGDKSDYYDVMSRFWTSLRGEKPAEWHPGARMVHVIEQREHGEEGAVIGRIADAVKTVRHHEQILLSKQSRLAQLSISDRKKKIRRIRLLRAGNTPSKMNQASQMATGLAEQDANERWRERNAKAWKQRRRLQERAETNGEAATDEPVEAADDMVELKPHDRELFGGLDRVPADQRIIW